jgi:hypothetical protein
MVNSTHAAYIYVLDDPLNGVDLTGPLPLRIRLVLQ